MSINEDTKLSDYFNEYRSHGLTDFEKNNSVPNTLKALLYNRYQYWNEGIPAGFKRFYKEQYYGKQFLWRCNT